LFIALFAAYLASSCLRVIAFYAGHGVCCLSEVSYGWLDGIFFFSSQNGHDTVDPFKRMLLYSALWFLKILQVRDRRTFVSSLFFAWMDDHDSDLVLFPEQTYDANTHRLAIA